MVGGENRRVAAASAAAVAKCGTQHTTQHGRCESLRSTMAGRVRAKRLNASGGRLTVRMGRLTGGRFSLMEGPEVLTVLGEKRRLTRQGRVWRQTGGKKTCWTYRGLGNTANSSQRGPTGLWCVRLSRRKRAGPGK